MGKRDIRWRETKKTKKDAKKVSSPISLVSTPVTVEVIKKGKKEEPPEEE